MNESILEYYRNDEEDMDRREFTDESQWYEALDNDNEQIDNLERARDMNYERGNIYG